jgi:hypothetical protein
VKCYNGNPCACQPFCDGVFYHQTFPRPVTRGVNPVAILASANKHSWRRHRVCNLSGDAKERQQWRNDLKKVNPIPSSNLSTTSARSFLTANSGTRNLRRCCTPSSSPHASSGTTFSRTRSTSCPASPWEKFYVAVTQQGASSSGRSS